MRYGKVWVAFVLVTAATGWTQAAKDSGPETLVRWHFAGTEQLKGLKKQTALRSILDLPETAALRDAAFAGFSGQAAARFSPQGGANSAESAAQIRELLPDLLRFETKFLAAAAPGGDADWGLAIKLPADREGAWRRQLTDLARSSGLRVNEGATWSASRERYHLLLEREGKWTLLRGGYSEVEGKAFAAFRKGLDKGSGKQVLSAELNLPRLGELWKAPRLSHAPRMVISATPSGDGFRSEVQLDYGHGLGIKPEKWELPTHIFREPLVGFTAIQGVRNSLKSSPHIQALGAAKVPNQLFAWSVGDTPFSTYVAGDVGNPREVIRNIMDRLVPAIRQEQGPLLSGRPQISSNGTTLAWRGLPVAVPFAQVAPEPNASYLVAGLFPVGNLSSNKVPAELFSQLRKKDLIYYEWEITEGRLTQWRPIWQLAYIVGSKQLIRSDAPSDRWLAAVTPKLGNTITQATLENDRRLRVIRQSHLGFNAMELVLLAHWLDPQDLRQPGSPARGAQSSQTPPPPPARNAETGR